LSEYREAEDELLWTAFRQDFEKWTVDHLQQTSVLLLGKLVAVLKSNGVYINDTKPRFIAENIAAAIAQEKP